jgi:pantoate--beta-alanine ligase
MEKDLALLEKLSVELVFTPGTEDLYPKGYQTWISVEDVAAPLEGAIRPGHFRGVATIVAKLFNSFQPDRAYFGQKDAQQAAVIRRMAADLNFPVEIVVCPTVRESDGLAVSSRNVYLNSRERAAATVLYRALNSAKTRYEAGELGGERLRQTMQSIVDSEPLADAEYVSVADPDTLKEVDVIDPDCHALLSLAIRIGKTRLIDNILL